MGTKARKMNNQEIKKNIEAFRFAEDLILLNKIKKNKKLQKISAKHIGENPNDSLENDYLKYNFKITEEIKTDKLYRECNVNFNVFSNDLDKKNIDIKFSDLELIFKDLKNLFVKQGYEINWKELEKQSLDQTINTLSMASPFSLEEKQVLLETTNLNERKTKLEEILSTYNFDNFENKTIQ